MADTRQFLYNNLTGQLGLNPQQALGVLYGLAGESGASLNPSSYNPNDPGGSIGFANWLGQRRTDLNALAKQMGVPPTDPAAQWAYMKNELTGAPGAVNYSNVLSALKQAPNAADATKIWTGQYEQPAVNNWQQRLAQAPYVGYVNASGNFVPGSTRGTMMAQNAAPGTSINTPPPQPTYNPLSGGSANTGLPPGIGAPSQPTYDPLSGGSANTGLPATAQPQPGGGFSIGGAIAKLTQPTEPGGQSPLQKLAKAFDPKKQDGGGGQQGGAQGQDAALQLQQAAAAQGNMRQQQIAMQAQQMAAAMRQKAMAPLTWGSQPYGSDAGLQMGIPGTTLNSMGA